MTCHVWLHVLRLRITTHHHRVSCKYSRRVTPQRLGVFTVSSREPPTTDELVDFDLTQLDQQGSAAPFVDVRDAVACGGPLQNETALL